MSDREKLQLDIINWMQETGKFTAPYGILDGMENFGRGKVRTVTFGIARTLDAHMKIVSTSDIRVRAKGPACTKYAGNFSSFDNLKKRYS
jgi:hypothetical protein